MNDLICVEAGLRGIAAPGFFMPAQQKRGLPLSLPPFDALSQEGERHAGSPHPRLPQLQVRASPAGWVSNKKPRHL